MILEIIMPSFYSMAQEEDTDFYRIENLQDYGNDEATSMSLELATMVDEKNLDKDNDKVKFAMETSEETKEFVLVTRKDFHLYDYYSYDNLDQAQEEFDKVRKFYQDQGLDLDIDLVEEDGYYFIHNNAEDEEKSDFGRDYKSYRFTVKDGFDFNKEGLQNKVSDQITLDRLFVFEFEIKESIDESFTMVSLEKDPDQAPLTVVNDGDIFAIIADNSYRSLYDSYELEADIKRALDYKEEKKKRRRGRKL